MSGWWVDEIGCRGQDAGSVRCSEVVVEWAWIGWDWNGLCFRWSTALSCSWREGEGS